MMQLDHLGQPCSLPASIMQSAEAVKPRSTGTQSSGFGCTVHGLLTSMGIAARHHYETLGQSMLLLDVALPGQVLHLGCMVCS